MLSSQDGKFEDYSMKMEELVKRNEQLEQKVASLEGDMSKAAVAFNSIVKGTERDFDLLRVEMDLMKESVRLLSMDILIVH